MKKRGKISREKSSNWNYKIINLLTVKNERQGFSSKLVTNPANFNARKKKRKKNKSRRKKVEGANSSTTVGLPCRPSLSRKPEDAETAVTGRKDFFMVVVNLGNLEKRPGGLIHKRVSHCIRTLPA